MNTQEIFDKVALHLLTQGKVAINELGNCVYRGENGTSCAVGCLISEANYHPDLEGVGVCQLGVQNAVAKSLGLPELLYCDVLLLESLQRIHDALPPFYWRKELQRLATANRLSTKIIDEFEKKGANNAVTQ